MRLAPLVGTDDTGIQPAAVWTYTPGTEAWERGPVRSLLSTGFAAYRPL